jgi:hypothetical protein
MCNGALDEEFIAGLPKGGGLPCPLLCAMIPMMKKIRK